MTRIIIFALTSIVGLAGLAAHAQEQPAPQDPPQQTCNVDTIHETDTGKTRPGVAICHEGNTGSVTVQVDPDVFKYPIGKSDKSVAKQVGNAVHHFFSHL